MKKHKRVNPIVSDAFIIWLTKLGYKAVVRVADILFISTQSGKGFPRDVMIMKNGRLNQPAAQLFEEFKSYKPFEGLGVAE